MSSSWSGIHQPPKGVDASATTRIAHKQRADAPSQQKLQKEASLLNALFEQAPDAVAILDADDRVIRVNREFTRLFGFPQDEVVQHPINDLIVPERFATSAAEYSVQIRSGGRVAAETIRRRKDGNEIRVSLIAVPVTANSGAQVASYAIYRDITEQKRAEEHLRESESRFQVMADTAPVLIWMTGTDGLCNYFNKPWLEFTGRTIEQEVGTGWLDGVHPDDVQLCFDGFLPAFQSRLPFRMEYRLRRADGEYRWVIESGIPRYTVAGEFAGYIGSNIDITDLKRAEEERERLRQIELDLAHINRVSMMGELAASLAHEINQPIAAAVINAKACTEWLKRDEPDIGEACECASRVANNATRAATILDRVRSLYWRDTSGREVIDLNEVIREIAGLLREKANRLSISIRTDLAQNLPLITADRIQMQQVCMNLMLNGIESMKDKSGELTITSKADDDHQIEIAVSDSGAGLPAGDIAQIFEAFFTTKPQGTGMGLSISRRIIESHGGRLWGASNPERGATFFFTLPCEFARW
jgi:PAS domain S-box-containing protein